MARRGVTEDVDIIDGKSAKGKVAVNLTDFISDLKLIWQFIIANIHGQFFTRFLVTIKLKTAFYFGISPPLKYHIHGNCTGGCQSGDTYL